MIFFAKIIATIAIALLAFGGLAVSLFSSRSDKHLILKLTSLIIFISIAFYGVWGG